MKRFSFVPITLLLFMMGCAPLSGPADAILKINASGELDVTPDMAEFNIVVTIVDKDITLANRRAGENITSVFEILNRFEIDKKDYHSSAIKLDKEYQWRNNTRVFVGYRLSSSISVKVKELTKLNRLLADLMANEELTISGFVYSHSLLETYKNDAYLKAVENANHLAENLKMKIGGRVINIIEISNMSEPVRGGSEPKMLTRGATMNSEGLPLNIGALKLRRSINVQYRVAY